jgi:hypothetical protein
LTKNQKPNTNKWWKHDTIGYAGILTKSKNEGKYCWSVWYFYISIIEKKHK